MLPRASGHCCAARGNSYSHAASHSHPARASNHRIATKANCHCSAARVDGHRYAAKDNCHHCAAKANGHHAL